MFFSREEHLSLEEFAETFLSREPVWVCGEVIVKSLLCQCDTDEKRVSALLRGGFFHVPKVFVHFVDESKGELWVEVGFFHQGDPTFVRLQLHILAVRQTQ